ncbi:uncharacterized protein TNCV_4549011 [Trichonephila clavipes]|nr:uncharacterized protein TNCV_4549011 [Trichonephila clavipes]
MVTSNHTDVNRSMVIEARLIGASVSRTVNLISISRTTVSRVMTAYTNLERFPKCLEALSRKLLLQFFWNFQGYALKLESFNVLLSNKALNAHYYGDGESTGFIGVKDTFRKGSVTKYECISHVQKRVGARLRKLKLKNKNLSGKGKLPDSFIDRLQKYYGIAVRSNVGNLSSI